MRRRIEKDGWSYIYEDTQKCDYEFTSVRYILGREIDKSKTKALIALVLTQVQQYQHCLTLHFQECRSMLKTVENIMHGI